MELRILIVEDQTISALYLKKVLEGGGHSTCGIARDADSALQLFVENKPDIILMDIILEGDMDGIDLTKKIMTIRKVPVVFITANQDHTIMNRIKNNDFFGFILKPYRSEYVLFVVETVMKKFENSRALFLSQKRLVNQNRILDEKLSILDMLFSISKDIHNKGISLEDMFRIIVDRIHDKLGLFVRVYWGHHIIECVDVPALIYRSENIVLKESLSKAEAEDSRIEVYFDHNNKDHVTLEKDKIKALFSIFSYIESLIDSFNKTQILVQEEKLSSIGRMAAGVAHELQTPIAFIRQNFKSQKMYTLSLIDFLENLKERCPECFREASEELSLDLDFIKEDFGDLMIETEDGLSRIATLSSNLNHLSRKKKSEERQPCDIHSILESSITITRNETKYVTEIVRDFGDIPLVPGNYIELGQVFINLLVNAAQAIRQEGYTQLGRITIETRSHGDTVSIRIIDNGPGIAPEKRDRIFESFFTTKGDSGTGLGLYITKDIIENKHKGSISVTSDQGKGCVFTITLPSTE